MTTITLALIIAAYLAGMVTNNHLAAPRLERAIRQRNRAWADVRRLRAQQPLAEVHELDARRLR